MLHPYYNYNIILILHNYDKHLGILPWHINFIKVSMKMAHWDTVIMLLESLAAAKGIIILLYYYFIGNEGQEAH